MTEPEATDPAAPMAAAPFVYLPDGRPDWAAMWTGFCVLALHGGPPHRGPDNPLLAVGADAAGSGFDAVAEITRGIRETTGLRAEPELDGWLAISCASRRMAAWMADSIRLENVDARSAGLRLLVPARPGFELKDQVKSVITVVAKVHHYWQVHLASGTQASAGAPADEDVPAIAAEFRATLVDWGRARSAHELRSAAELHDRLHILTERLRQAPVGKRAIEGLLADPDPWVRVWSASESFAWSPAPARHALEAIAITSGGPSIDARWALLQLDAGRQP